MARNAEKRYLSAAWGILLLLLLGLMPQVGRAEAPPAEASQAEAQPAEEVEGVVVS